MYTHLFRHIRATELAKIMKEPALKEHFGRVSESDMPGNYVRLSGKDVDNLSLEAHGIKMDKEDKVQMALTLTEGPRCKNQTTSEAQFCAKCGMPLSNESANKLEGERSVADRLMDALMEDDEVKQLLA